MMKMIKKVLAALLLIAVLATSVGCYMISGQKMDDVKGTYRMTHYTRTPKYEYKAGYTAKTTNYIEDENYLYQNYLVITGTGTGYFVHKNAKDHAYVKEIVLSYEYNPDDSSKVDYVIYNDSTSVNQTTGINRLGVSGKTLNYSKAGFDYTELFTGKKMRSEEISVRWEKVDDATDLSYVKSQFGDLKYYGYQAFAVRGIYQLELSPEVSVESGYQYYYYLIDTADNAVRVTAYYATKDAPTDGKTLVLSATQEGEFSTLTVDDVVWTVDPSFAGRYYADIDGNRHTLYMVRSDISESTLQYLIESQLPTQE